MSLRVCVLASSSSGNCTWIASPTTAILVDAGLSARAILQRMEAIGADPRAVKAVAISHEHSDHISGIVRMQRLHGVALYANEGTRQGIERDPAFQGLEWRQFSTGHAFEIGDLRISPFAVPHDAYDPVGFVIEHGGVALGIATDLGTPTSLIRERLRPCRALILEANHDEHMLHLSRRPWPLKQRILGRQGHLSNRMAAEMAAEIAGPGLTDIFLAHLSAECNDPRAAREAVEESLRAAGHAHVRVRMTYPDKPGEMWMSDE
ncbi:MAG: MBL fold metallo-hydrolase [Verrucomicrobia bacterium]|nr:MBL fold metallo-hydrolase [Verrucomicrobiota bacterium]